MREAKMPQSGSAVLVVILGLALVGAVGTFLQ